MARRINSCCCFSLRTGAVIIGIVFLIGGFGSICQGLQFSFIPLTIEGAVLLPISVCLLIGVLKEKPYLLLPFIVGFFVYAVYLTVLPIVAHEIFQRRYIITSTYNTAIRVDIDDQINNIIIAAVASTICLYFCAVVYSLFRAMKEESTRTNASKDFINA